MDWYPHRDEDLLIRTSAAFGTGMHPAVAGSRWFRDPDGPVRRSGRPQPGDL